MNGSLCIYLFGKSCVKDQNEKTLSLELIRVQELFYYLLLHANRPHTREKLAELLWQESPNERSRKYLRQTLWKLQSILDKVSMGRDFLIVESDWLQINPNAMYWLDTQVLEAAYLQAQGLKGSEISPGTAQLLIKAVRLYKGDLLENWYHEWCLFERERLQNIYLTMLFKLMVYCEYAQQFEAGIMYGMKMLRCDPARERTYRQLMRLHFLAGDRIGALRLYERCRVVLENELHVKPAGRTIDLMQKIRKGDLPDKKPEQSISNFLRVENLNDVQLVSCLTRARELLFFTQQQIDHYIDILQTQDSFKP